MLNPNPTGLIGIYPVQYRVAIVTNDEDNDEDINDMVKPQQQPQFQDNHQPREGNVNNVDHRSMDINSDDGITNDNADIVRIMSQTYQKHTEGSSSNISSTPHCIITDDNIPETSESVPETNLEREAIKSRQLFVSLRQMFEIAYRRTNSDAGFLESNTDVRGHSITLESNNDNYNRQNSIASPEEMAITNGSTTPTENQDSVGTPSNIKDLQWIPANTVQSRVNFFESHYTKSPRTLKKTSKPTSPKQLNGDYSKPRRTAPSVPQTTKPPLLDDDEIDKEPTSWNITSNGFANHSQNGFKSDQFNDSVSVDGCSSTLARNASSGSYSNSSHRSTTTTTTSSLTSATIDYSTNGSTNFDLDQILPKPATRTEKLVKVPTYDEDLFLDSIEPDPNRYPSLVDDPSFPGHSFLHNRKKNNKSHKIEHLKELPPKPTPRSAFSNLHPSPELESYSHHHHQQQLHHQDADDEEEELEYDEEPRKRPYSEDLSRLFTQCDISINVSDSTKRTKNRNKPKSRHNRHTRNDRTTRKRQPKMRNVTIELNLFNDSNQKPEDQPPKQHRYELQILPQNLRSLFNQLLELDQYPRASHHYYRRQSQINSQDSAATVIAESWKRKAIYRRNLSSIDDYLVKNLTNSSSGNNVFQSNYPWKTFIQNSRYRSRIDSLTESEIKLYESIFEIIMTERSYLNNLEELKEFPTKNSQLMQQISKYDQNILFGNVGAIYEVNHKLYKEFISAFGKSIFMSEVIIILSIYLSGESGKKFEPYIDYVRAQNERSRLMQNESLMMASNGGGAGNGIKTTSSINSLQLQGLLISPMQRITRYPILLGAIRDRLSKIINQNPDQDEESISGTDAGYPTTPTPNHHTLDLRRQSNPQPPAHHLLLALVEKCWENAKRFAQKCNQALDNQNNLLELIEFKKRLVGDLGFELVSTERKILNRIPVLVNKHFLSLLNTSVLSSSTNSLMPHQKCILIVFNDLLILAVDKHKKKKNENKFILINNAPWNLVEYRKGLWQSPTPTHNIPPNLVSEFFPQSEPDYLPSLGIESELPDSMLPVASLPLSISTPSPTVTSGAGPPSPPLPTLPPPPPPPPPLPAPPTSTSSLTGILKFTKNSNDTHYQISFVTSELEEKFSTELARLKSQ